MPAKYSERNARLDDLPTMAFPLPLTPEQAHRILASVKNTDGATSGITVKPADQLPPSVALRELPPDVTAGIPAVQGLSYVKTEDRVLLVKPILRVVVGEITL